MIEADRPDLTALALAFAVADAELVTAQAYRDLIAGTNKALAHIAASGPITDALADSIETTVRRFDQACGRPVLIEVAAPELNVRVARALQAGERAYEASRSRMLEVIEFWEPPLLALATGLVAERESLTPLFMRFALVATIAGVDPNGPDQIAATRAFGRFLLGQPIDASVAAPTAHSEVLANA